jgi:hypothetical protein
MIYLSFLKIVFQPILLSNIVAYLAIASGNLTAVEFRQKTH